ncbi:hypothetical protein GF385_02375 [Candidatus Dependentiae bacterium]|nr:hypothetical protein [Candidatus Dependentiae bacterium]
MRQITKKNYLNKLTENKSLAYKITFIILLSWIYAIGSQIYITLPFEFIPITLQTFMIFLSPFIFGNLAFYATALWLFQGLLGFPVFFELSGGFTHLMGPSGGYLIGFLFSSYYLSNVKSKNILILYLNLFISLIILHTCGIFHSTKFSPLNINAILFFLIDLIKITFIPFIICKNKKDIFN